MNETKTKNLSKYYDYAYFDGERYGYKGYTFEKLAPEFRSKLDSVKKYSVKGKLLDVGCAKGFFVKLALDAGFDAYGVDFSRYGVREAQKLVGNRALNADVEESIPFPKENFDIITAWDFLEHLKNPQRFLQKANLLLRHGGYLFFTTINNESLMARLIKDRFGSENSLHLSYFITPRLLERWLTEAEFQVVILRTFMLYLAPLPKKLLVMEKLLYKSMLVFQPFLRITGLGDAVFCVAKKQEHIR